MFVKKVSIYSIGEILNRSSKFVSLFLLASLLSKVDMGIYNFFLSSAALVLVLLDSGLNTLIFIRASGNKIHQLFNIFVICKLILGLVILPLSLLIFNLTIGIPEKLLSEIFIFALFSAAWDFSLFLSIAQRCKFDYFGEAVAKVIWSLSFVFILLVYWVFEFELTLQKVLSFQTIGFLIAIFWSIGRLYAKGIIFIRIDRKLLKRVKMLFLISIPLSTSMLAASVFNSVDQLFLGYYAEYEFLASFGLAQRLALFMYMPISVAQAFIFPYLSNNYRRLNVTEDNILRLRYAFVIGLLLSVSLTQATLLGVDLVFIPMLPDEAYNDISWIVQSVVLYLPAASIHGILWTILMAMRHTVSANLSISLIVPFIWLFDYLMITYISIEYIVYSPLIGHLALFGALAYLLNSKIGYTKVLHEVTIAILIVICLLFLLNSLEATSFKKIEILRLILISIPMAISWKLFKSAGFNLSN